MAEGLGHDDAGDSRNQTLGRDYHPRPRRQPSLIVVESHESAKSFQIVSAEWNCFESTPRRGGLEFAKVRAPPLRPTK
jgi:hypothetical protein